MLLFNDQPDSATVTYAVGESRLSKAWATVTSSWTEFRTKCETFKDTGETMAEYDAMERDQQGRIKDCGGFVGGILTGGRRDKRSVQCRYMICLDFDHVDAPWDTFIAAVRRALEGKAWVAYTTHKHREGATRARLVVPVAQPILPENYEPVARALCSKVGIDWADSTTYAAERLMYWPTRSSDAPWHAEHQDGEAATQTWCLAGTGVVVSDPATWPRGANDDQGRTVYNEAKGSGHMPDPTKKENIVGWFCKAHWPLSEALDELLPGLYAKVNGNRLTWTAGSSSGGVLIYPDSSGEKQDCYLWSTHDTDPAKGMHNIFDLCRIHMFGNRDLSYRIEPNTPNNRLPSYLEMEIFAKNDPKTKAIMDDMRKREIDRMQSVMDGAANQSPEVADKPAPPIGRGTPKFDNTINGALGALGLLIPNVYLDEFSGCPFVEGDLPWRKNRWARDWDDRDDACLRAQLENLGVTSADKISCAFETMLNYRRRDLLRERLEKTEWDGIPRIVGGLGSDGVYRKPLLTRFMGVADTEVTRAMTKAFFVGLALRGLAYKPIKHDYVLALLGPEGIGKSRFCRIIGGDFFANCSLDLDNKDSFLVMYSTWVLEFAEIVSFKKSSLESLKSALTTEQDKFRDPYARRERKRFRRCVFIATTNEYEFIKSDNGMRQMWPMECTDSPDREDLSVLQEEVDQVIAEAVYMATHGEMNMLTPQLEKQARELQRQHNSCEDDSMKPELEAFLERGVPATWEKMPRQERRTYSFRNIDELKVVRNKFYAPEFVTEVYNYTPGTQLYKQTVRKVNKLMEEMPGWEFALVTVSDYGRQKGWVRKSAPTPSEGDFVGDLL